MRTSDVFTLKKVADEAFDSFKFQMLSDEQMNVIRGGGDPPQDDDPIDIIFPPFPKP
jgi:hypothetical protein